MLVSMGAFDGCRTSWAARRRSQGLATQWSWTPMVLESYGTLGLSSSSKNDTLATSSAILFLALHTRVQESCGRIG